MAPFGIFWLGVCTDMTVPQPFDCMLHVAISVKVPCHGGEKTSRGELGKLRFWRAEIAVSKSSMYDSSDIGICVCLRGAVLNANGDNLRRMNMHSKNEDE